MAHQVARCGEPGAYNVSAYLVATKGTRCPLPTHLGTVSELETLGLYTLAAADAASIEIEIPIAPRSDVGLPKQPGQTPRHVTGSSHGRHKGNYSLYIMSPRPT